MKKTTKHIMMAAAAVVCTAVSAAPALAQEADNQSIPLELLQSDTSAVDKAMESYPDVIATVDGQDITKQEVMDQLNQLLRFNPMLEANADQAIQSVVQDMINQKIFVS